MDNPLPPAPAPAAPVAPHPALDSFGTLWGLTWKQYQGRFRLFFPIALIGSAGSILTSILANSMDEASFLLAVVGFMLTLITSLLSGAALVYAVVHPEITSLAQAYQGGMTRLWTWILSSLLTGLIIFGGTLLLIIPGIIFGVMFTFAAYLVYRENLGVIESLKRSKALVKGRWFDVFWRILVLFILIFLLAFALGFFAALATLGNEPFTSILADIATAVVTPISAIFLHFLYETLYRSKVPETSTPLAV